MRARRHARTRGHPRLRRSSGRRRRAASSRHWRRSSRAPRALASTTGPGSLGHLAALRLQPGPPFGGTSTANRPLKWPGHSVCFRAGWEGGGADEAQSSPGAASLFSLVFVMQGHESESAGPGFVTRSVVTVRACGGPGTEAALPVQACHWQPALQPGVTGSRLVESGPPDFKLEMVTATPGHRHGDRDNDGSPPRTVSHGHRDSHGGPAQGSPDSGSVNTTT
jgi:hypothetical protein